MSFAGTNYWAILIAAAAGWIAGAAWYMSLGKYWQEAIGMSAEQMAANRRNPYAWVPFVLAFLANLVMAWTLAGILFHVGPITVRSGIIAGALCWFGFVLTTIATNYAFHDRKVMLTVIDAGHWLAVLVVMGAIIGAFGVR